MHTDVYEMIAVAPLHLLFFFFKGGRGLAVGGRGLHIWPSGENGWRRKEKRCVTDDL